MTTNPKMEKRSVFQVISEDGVMNTRRIFRITRTLCDKISAEERGDSGLWISSRNVYLGPRDEVSVDTAVPSAPAVYRSPEGGDAESVYAIGILMIFMASGEERKSRIDSMVTQRRLKELIERCISVTPSMRFQNVSEISRYIGRNHRIVKRTLFTLFLITCLCTVAFAGVYFYSKGNHLGNATGRREGYSSGYSDGYAKGYMDAPSIGLFESSFHPLYGNLSANINIGKGAFAVRSEEEVFFINRGSIYGMNPYTGDTRMLLKEADASNINYYKGSLYYSRDGHICRYDLKNAKEDIFCHDKDGLLYIVEGEFYLDDIGEGGYLYKLDPSTGSARQLNALTDAHCFDILDRRIYFSDPHREFNLYSCDLDGSNIKLLNSNSCEQFCICDGKIYAYAANYKDFDKKVLNFSASFLIRIDADGGGMQKYGSLPVRDVNVTDAGIFYVSGNSRALHWMSSDARMDYRIVSTRTGAFNVAGRWIFYINEDDEDRLWRVRIDGSDNERLDDVDESN